MTAEFLSSLPADQMLSLEVVFCRERKVVVSAVSKMRNLKSLKLSDCEEGEGEKTFSSIFDNMNHLEEVELIGCRNDQDDRMIATLANQNPKLRHVSFYQICLTEAALTSLAQLQHLTDVRIHEGQQVTTAGIMTLLRGSSRNVIRNIAVSRENLDDDQVTREVSRMCEERGISSFDTQHTSYLFIYAIDVWS